MSHAWPEGCWKSLRRSAVCERERWQQLVKARGSALLHSSSRSSSLQMQALRWLFMKGRQPRVQTALNTVSATDSQAAGKEEIRQSGAGSGGHWQAEPCAESCGIAVGNMDCFSLGIVFVQTQKLPSAKKWHQLPSLPATSLRLFCLMDHLQHCN